VNQEEEPMTIRKTMTDKAVAANQKNGPKSNGPNHPIAGNQHARKHGLQSKHLVFKTEEEQQEFDALLNDLLDDHKPAGRTELELVEMVAVDFWKTAEENGWEMRELAHRTKAAAAILTTLAENYDGEQLPLFTEPDGSHSAVKLGWDCQELVVRTGTRNSEENEGIRKDNRRGKVGHVQIEARLNTSLDTLLRYHAAIKRDLYDALKELRSTQRERREKNVAQGDEAPITRGRPLEGRGKLD
jgi:hypothetical protein